MGGFPDFNQSLLGSDVQYGMTLLPDTSGIRQRVSASDLGNPTTIEERFRAIHAYATDPARSGGAYVGGFPDCEEDIVNNAIVYGVILIQDTAGVRAVVSASDLGNPPTIEERFRAIHAYATDPARSGGDYVGGFPDFNQSLVNGQLVYGMTLIREAAGIRDVIPGYRLGFLTDFTHHPNVTRDQILQLRIHHATAASRINSCGNLNDAEKNNLKQAYQKVIYHDFDNNPLHNASAQKNGSTIWVNFGVLLPKSDDEISQTLIHEMMHIAGYDHPNRIDPPDPSADVPGDNGPYYGTAPLRAELCIAGNQSLVQLHDVRRCNVNTDGSYSISDI